MFADAMNDSLYIFILKIFLEKLFTKKLQICYITTKCNLLFKYFICSLTGFEEDTTGKRSSCSGRDTPSSLLKSMSSV